MVRKAGALSKMARKIHHDAARELKAVVLRLVYFQLVQYII